MRIVTLILLLALGVPLWAQQKLSYFQVDSASYALYNQGNAKGLRKIVKQAKKNDIDYYYLRMRAGIAHYNKGNFEEAATHFKYALQYFPIDTLAAEYLYFSYANSARPFDAALVAPKLAQSQRDRYGIKPKPVQSVSIGGGYAISDNQQKNGTMQLWEDGSIFGATYMLNNSAYGQLSMVNNISKRIKLFSAYTYYNLQNTHRIQSQLQNVSATFDTSFNYTTQQHDVYVSPTIYIGKGFYVSPAFHFIDYGFNTTTRIYFPAPPSFQNVTVSQKLIYSGAEAGYRFKYGAVAVNVGVSAFDTLDFTHASATLSYYPLGNTNLYGVTTGMFLNDKVANHFAFSQKVGVKLFKNTWLEAGFVTGKLRYFAEGNGFTIYTIPDDIYMKASAMFNVIISKRFALSAGYVYLQRQGAYNVVTTPFLFQQKFYNYNNHLVTTTLTFTP